MAVDTGIYQNLLRAPKSVAEYQAEMDQADLARTQNLIGKASLAERQATVDRAAGLRSLASRWGAETTDDQRVNDLKNSGYFDQADSLVKTNLERDKTRATISKDRAESQAKDTDMKLKQFQHIAQAAAGVRDQAGWDQLKQLADVFGIDTSRMPPEFSPQYAKMVQDSFTTVSDRLAAQKQQQEAQNDVMVPDGKGGFMVNQPYVNAKQSISKAGASNVNVKVDAKLGEGVAKEVGPMVAASYNTAMGAQDQMATADRLISAVDSGKTFTGPGATFRLRAAQIGDTLGITGKDTQEKIANTRAAIQGLAQSTVAARSALKGQGQVSDYEGKLLQRAASGEIDDLTAAEIKQIAQVNRRLAEQQIKQHQQVVSKLKGFDSTAPLSTLFEIPAAQPVTPASLTGRQPAGRPPLDSFGK